MSFGNNRKWTIILIILIPLAAFLGWLMAYSNYSNINNPELTIEGSTTVHYILENTTKVFIETHPNVKLTIEATSSSAGITSLTEGLIDIAMSSRPVDTNENSTANGNLRSYAIAKDVLAIVVNSVAESFSISSEIARAIFNGTITDWSDPKLVDSDLSGPIQVVVRDAGSGSRQFFDEVIMGDATQQILGSRYVSNAIEKTSSQLLAEAISQNQNYIGYIGLGLVNNGIEAIGINNIFPTIETIKNESYLIQRNLYLITNGIPEVGSIIREFINWSLSPTSQEIISDLGFVPIVASIDKYD